MDWVTYGWLILPTLYADSELLEVDARGRGGGMAWGVSGWVVSVAGASAALPRPGSSGVSSSLITSSPVSTTASSASSSSPSAGPCSSASSSALSSGWGLGRFGFRSGLGFACRAICCSSRRKARSAVR